MVLLVDFSRYNIIPGLILSKFEFQGTKAMTQKDGGDESENPVLSNEQGLYLEESLRFEVKLIRLMSV